MKILKTHLDGSETKLYEKGDRLRLLKVQERDWLVIVGEEALVWDYSDKRDNPSSITFLEIRTDTMIKDNWGVVTVAPWNVELVDKR